MMRRLLNEVSPLELAAFAAAPTLLIIVTLRRHEAKAKRSRFGSGRQQRLCRRVQTMAAE
jgi:hypothetical protein